MDTATNERMERLAGLSGQPLTFEEADNLARRLEQLQLDTARGIDTSAEWRQWERDYMDAGGM